MYGQRTPWGLENLFHHLHVHDRCSSTPCEILCLLRQLRIYCTTKRSNCSQFPQPSESSWCLNPPVQAILSLIYCPGLVSIRNHPFACTVLLTCGAPFSQITSSLRLTSSGFSNPNMSPASEVLWVCVPRAAGSLRLITKGPVVGTLKYVEGSNCAGTQPVSLLWYSHGSMPQRLSVLWSLLYVNCQCSVSPGLQRHIQLWVYLVTHISAGELAGFTETPHWCSVYVTLM
jgi:hypothetical protein